LTRLAGLLNAPGVESLAVRYRSALTRFFQRRVHDHADVDDLVQEVFLRLTRRGNLQEIENIEGYIFQTAANALRDRLRQRFVHKAGQHEELSEEHAEDAAFSPERVLLGREAIQHLNRALFELPERTRTVFFMCRIEGMPYAEVGERLGISLSAVNKHMAKSIGFLLTRMQEESW
jgi:RNA polymerase sigma factor (sigma-70 family)